MVTTADLAVFQQQLRQEVNDIMQQLRTEVNERVNSRMDLLNSISVAMQIRSRMCAREFKSDDRPDLYAGTPPLEALKAIISIAANHKERFSIMHVDVSRAYFHAKAQRPVLIRLPAEDRMEMTQAKLD